MQRDGIGRRQRAIDAAVRLDDADATARDKAVWDRLSDQPHQHAGKLEKTLIRLADAPGHLRDFAIVGASLPEAHGGAGLGFLATALACEQLGAAAAPVPSSANPGITKGDRFLAGISGS